jgi:hypothetical protein
MPASPGLHGAFAEPTGSCRFRLLVPPGRPFGAAGRDIRVLAFRDRAAEEPAWSKLKGCLAGEPAARMLRLAAVIDPGRPGGSADAPSGPGSGMAPGQGWLPGAPSVPAARTCIAVSQAGPQPQAGAGIAGRWCGAFSGSGGQVGCGDRAILPGRSSRYHLIRLVCGQCGTELALLFFDQGDLPQCANCPDGQMEVLG